MHVQSQKDAELLVEKAQHILEQAVEKSKHMVEQTDFFQRELEKESRDLFLKTSKRYMEFFEQNLLDLGKSYKGLLQTVEDPTHQKDARTARSHGTRDVGQASK
jgi:hypothetical protein